jgi:hypothetical protein
MIELRTTEPPRAEDATIPPSFAHDGASDPDLESEDDVEDWGSGDWALERDAGAGPSAWRLRREIGRAPSGWMFVADEGGPIRFDAPAATPSTWSLTLPLGRGHLVAFSPAAGDEGTRSRGPGAVLLIGAVIMGVSPATAAAATQNTAPTPWDELTQDVDRDDPSLPRYGSGAVMVATKAPTVGATSAVAPPDDWAQLVGSQVIVVSGTGTALGTLMMLDTASAVVQLPSGETRSMPRDTVTSIAPADTGGTAVYSPTYGKQRVIWGSIATGVGGAAMVMGIAWAGYSVSSYSVWAPILVPGVVVTAVGIPLLITGLQRKRRRGQPAASNLRVAPVVTRTFTGAGLHLRF